MKDKEKQITEFIKYLRECSNNAWAKGFDYAEMDNEKLREFLALLPEDSVVLSKEEYDTLRAENDKYVKDCIDYLATINKLENKVWEVEQQSSKETAEKFYEFAKAWFGDDEQNDYFVEVKNFAKQFGVEIKDV